MKTRESGMPDENYWVSFFDVDHIFKELEINDQVFSLVDFGAGYGTFSLPASRVISGKVHAYEIESELADELLKKSQKVGLDNLTIHNRDFVESGSGLEENSVDYVMIFNILHATESPEILKEAYRILKRGGKLGVIHWRYDQTTPRGPGMDIRPKPEELEKLIQGAGFKILKFNIDLPPYHYGILAKRKNQI